MITIVLAEDVSVRVADAYYTAIARLTDTRQIEKNRSFNSRNLKISQKCDSERHMKFA